MLDDDVEVLNMHKAVAQGARHLRVHLGDDQVGGLDGRPHRLHRHPQRAKAKTVGRRDLDQRHIQGHAPAAKQLRESRTGRWAYSRPAPRSHRRTDARARQRASCAESAGRRRLLACGAEPTVSIWTISTSLSRTLFAAQSHQFLQQMLRLAAARGSGIPGCHCESAQGLARAHAPLGVVLDPLLTTGIGAISFGATGAPEGRAAGWTLACLQGSCPLLPAPGLHQNGGSSAPEWRSVAQCSGMCGSFSLRAARR